MTDTKAPIQATHDLEEVRKAVFGDVGDEPNVYADYDRCSELSGKMRRAIAALSAAQAQPVAIKPLEWEDNRGVGFNATTVSGIYSIDIGAGEYRVFVPGKWPPVGYTLLEAAKAAAQSDYEARIRSALVPTAVPGEVHAQLALIKHLAEYTTEKNWDDKRLYIMQAVDRALSVPVSEIEGGDKGDLDDLQTLGTSKQWTRLIQSLEQFRNRDTNEDVEVWADIIESAVEGFRTEANRVLAVTKP